jgi:hypothetical protein
MLSHPHRRRVLTLISRRNPRDEAEFAPDAPAGDVGAISLQHNHLPKLADAGFIDWDRERQRVMRGPRFDEIAPLLDLLHAHRDELPADWL